MKRALLLAGVLLAAWTAPVGAADDTHEKLVKDMIKVFKDGAATLKTIKDEESAKAAQPKLKKLGAALKDIRARGQKLGKPQGDTEEQLKTKYKGQIEASQKEFSKEVMRVATVPGGKEALAAMGLGKPQRKPKE